MDTFHTALCPCQKTRTKVDTRECAWEKRKISGQPNTKEIAQKKNLPRAEHASTRWVTQFHHARSSETTACRRPGSTACPAVRAPRVMPNSRRPARQRPRHQRAFLQCAQCCADPGHAFTGDTDSGFMGHMSRKRGGQTLTPERCCSAATAGQSV